MVFTKDCVYIIVLNWNRTDDTINCLKSIKNIDYKHYITILVDNNSDNDSFHKLSDWCNNNYQIVVNYTKSQIENDEVSDNKLLENSKSADRLVLIENCRNLGFAGGNNIALRYALKNNAEYALLLNNDTILTVESITKLADFMRQNTEFVAVTPQIRYLNKVDTIWNCGGEIKWYGNRKYYYANRNISKVPQHGHKIISFITGCALFFKLQTTGILTDKFFFNGDDYEFSLRQKKQNNKMACVFDSVIYHKVHSSLLNVKNNILGEAYLFYLSRFINNRDYSSKVLFEVIKLLNLLYAFFMLQLRYHIKLMCVLRMFKTLLKQLKLKNEIEKDYYFKYINYDFNK